MFIIKHLPSKTIYGIHNNNQTSIVCCKNYKDAVHISNSLYTYRKLHDKSPSHTEVFFYPKNNQPHLHNSLESDYNIHNVYHDIEDYMSELSKNKLSMLFVHCIFPKIHTTELRLKKNKVNVKDELDNLFNIDY